MKLSLKKSVLTRTLTSLTTCVIIAILSGCSDAEADHPDLEETTDASVSDPTEYIPASEDGPAENVPEPKLPALAVEDSVQGAQATLEYFWEAETYASLTGDSSPLTTVSSEDCAFCTESIQGWPRNYEEGYWSAMHGEIEIDFSEVLMDSYGDEGEKVAHLYFELTEPPTDFFDDEGERMEGSFESNDVQQWLGELSYDATAQLWQVEWLGLEEEAVWED